MEEARGGMMPVTKDETSIFQPEQLDGAAVPPFRRRM